MDPPPTSSSNRKLLIVQRSTNESGAVQLIPIRSVTTPSSRTTDSAARPSAPIQQSHAISVGQPPGTRPASQTTTSTPQTLASARQLSSVSEPMVATSPPRRPLQPSEIPMNPLPIKRGDSRVKPSVKLPTSLYYKGTREDRRPLSVYEKQNNVAKNRTENRVNRAHTNYGDKEQNELIHAGSQDNLLNDMNLATPEISRESTISSTLASLSVLSQGDEERADSISISQQLTSISRQTTLQTELSKQSLLPIHQFICQLCEKNIANKQPYRPLCYHVFCQDCCVNSEDCEICHDKIIQNRENTIIIRRDDTKDDVFTGILHHKRRYFQVLPLLHKEYTTLAATQKRERQGLLRKYAQFLIGPDLNNPLLTSQRVYELMAETIPHAQREAYTYGTTIGELDKIFPKDDPKRANWRIPLEMEILLFTVLQSSFYQRRKVKEILRKFECDFLNTTLLYEDEVAKRGFRDDVYRHMTTDVTSPNGIIQCGAAIMTDIEERLVFLLKLTHDSLKFDNLHHGELWLRLGCDRGSGITKVMISIANRPYGKVNSPFNWMIVAAYDGHDDYNQLKKYAGTVFKAFDNIKELKVNHTIYPVRKIVIGDVNSLNAIYGLRGAASKYPCYQCTIPKECVQTYRHGGIERSDIEAKQKVMLSNQPENTSKKIDSDENKSYDYLPLLPFDSTARAPPCLHMIQGPTSIIFKRIESIVRLSAIGQLLQVPITEDTFLKSEDELSKVVASATETEVRRRKEAFVSYQRTVQKGTHLWTADTICTTHCSLGHLKKVSKLSWIECAKCKRWQHQLCLGMKGGEYDGVHNCGKCSPQQPQTLFDQLKTALMIAEQSAKNAVLVKDIHCSPIIRAFRQLCNKYSINLGSFHGGQLTGNQCRSLLKNTKVFTNYVRSLDDQESDSDALSTVADKLDNVMQPLSKANSLLAARFLEKEEIIQYEEHIQSFLEGWRKAFPHINGFPKIHILTTESVAFLNRFSTLGLVSEQGVESSHPLFNSSWERCNNIKPAGARLAKSIEYHNNRNMLLYSINDKSNTGYMDILTKEVDDS